jgi:hypothetical protein
MVGLVGTVVLGAVLEAGPGAVASHLAAAALWRFEGFSREHVEVTVPAGRHPVPDHGPSTGAVTS